MTGHEPERLTALDAAFLHIERDGLPVHLGSVGIFEAEPLLDETGALRLDELRAQVAGRLDRLPRLRRRITQPALGLGRPCWVDDPAFNVRHHIDAVDLPGGDLDDVRHHAEELAAQRLPADRPLWHLRFVTGLTGPRVGLIERVHHAMVDGVSGVDVATVLLDLTPEVEAIRPSAWMPAAPPSPAELAAAGLVEHAVAPLRASRSLVSAALHPTRTLRQAAEVVEAMGTLAADGLVAPRTALNQPIGHTRALTWIGVDLADVKRAGRSHEATANDVILTAVAEGLRALLLGRGAAIAGHDVLKVLVPVSFRDAGQRGTLGNRVGAFVLRLPIGIADPAARLQTVAHATERLKARREADTAQLMLAAADALPAALVGPVARLTDQQRVVNVIVTNVPGPAVPLYCRGARMLEAFPVVPLGGNLGLSIAILSYDGRITLGITTDPVLVPDVDVVAKGITAALQALGAVPHRRPRRGGGTSRTA